MGYRTYIGVMPKKEYNKIKSLTKEQLYAFKGEDLEDGYVGVYDFSTTLYNFGKDTDFNPPKKSVQTFFKKKETRDYYLEEKDLNIVTKEFLEYIIEYYSQKVKTYQSDMLSPFFPDIKTVGFSRKSSDFLNSVQTEYNFPKNQHTFDFTKITQEEQNALFEIIEHMRGMHFEWVSIYRPFCLKDGDEVVTSNKYEYAVFELVRIYKTFDWKRNVLVYYGY